MSSTVLGSLVRTYKVFNPPAASDDTPKSLRFACLGANYIAPFGLVTPARSHPEVVLYVVADVSEKAAQTFAKKHGFEKAYGGPTGYEAVINDREVDVVYNCLPNELHFEWTMKALAAGKHVLLESLACDTSEETSQMYAFAAGKGLVLLDAFHYRFHPAIQRLKAIMDGGELGVVRSIRVIMDMGCPVAQDAKFNPAMCFAVSCMRYLASANPTTVLSAEYTPFGSPIHAPRLDRAIAATFEFKDGLLGEIHGDVAPTNKGSLFPIDISALVECEGGKIEMFNFALPMFYHTITVTSLAGPKRVERAYTFPPESGNKGEEWWSTYRYQLEAFVDQVQGRMPQMWVESQDAVDNLKWIEAVYVKAGLGLAKSHYEKEWVSSTLVGVNLVDVKSLV